MKSHIITAANVIYGYGQLLIKDIPADKRLAQPHGIPNHPVWIVGHLTGSASRGIEQLGGSAPLPDGWAETFGIASKPVTNPAAYPDWQTLTDKLATAHQAFLAALQNADDARLAMTNPLERARGRFPTIGDFAVYLLTVHPATHWGQLSSWRRAIGMPSAM